MNDLIINRVEYKPGYGDMLGGYHNYVLEKNDEGNWIMTSTDQEDHNSQRITTCYEVETESVEQFFQFIVDNDVFSLQEREASDLFAYDYSPWYWYIEILSESAENSIRLEQYKEYSEQDSELLREMAQQFLALRWNPSR